MRRCAIWINGKKCIEARSRETSRDVRSYDRYALSRSLFRLAIPVPLTCRSVLKTRSRPSLV